MLISRNRLLRRFLFIKHFLTGIYEQECLQGNISLIIFLFITACQKDVNETSLTTHVQQNAKVSEPGLFFITPMCKRTLNRGFLYLDK